MFIYQCLCVSGACACGGRLQYLGVLIGCDGGEVGLWEGHGVVGAPADREDAVRLDHVESGEVSVHGVQDDLKRDKEKREGKRRMGRKCY